MLLVGSINSFSKGGPGIQYPSSGTWIQETPSALILGFRFILYTADSTFESVVGDIVSDSKFESNVFHTSLVSLNATLNILFFS